MSIYSNMVDNNLHAGSVFFCLNFLWGKKGGKVGVRGTNQDPLRKLTKNFFRWIKQTPEIRDPLECFTTSCTPYPYFLVKHSLDFKPVCILEVNVQNRGQSRPCWGSKLCSNFSILFELNNETANNFKLLLKKGFQTFKNPKNFLICWSQISFRPRYFLKFIKKVFAFDKKLKITT